MNWEALGAIGEIIGAIAVVATLIYLTKQIRANSVQLQTNSVTDLASLFNEAFMPIYTDEKSRKIWVTGLKDPDSLDEVDQTVFDLFMFRLFNPFEVVLAHHARGALDKETLRGYARRMHGMALSSPGGVQWIERNKHLIDGAALKFIEEETSGPTEHDA